MKHTTIESEWRDFRAKVLPPQAPAVQVSEMRKAFYAGASMMLSIVWHIGGEDVSEGEGAAIMERLEREMQAFVAGLQRTT